jgi:hypothetical protein
VTFAGERVARLTRFETSTVVARFSYQARHKRWAWRRGSSPDRHFSSRAAPSTL